MTSDAVIAQNAEILGISKEAARAHFARIADNLARIGVRAVENGGEIRGVRAGDLNAMSRRMRNISKA